MMKKQDAQELTGSDIDKLGKLMDTDQSLSFQHFALKVDREVQEYPRSSYTILAGSLISAGYDDWESFCEEENPTMSEVIPCLISPFMEANPDFLLNLPSKETEEESPGDNGGGSGTESSQK